MATYKTNESSKWREFLKPLVTALVALAAAATVYLKTHGETQEVHEANIRTQAALEMLVKQNRSDIEALKNDNALMKATLYQIGNDVSFIRGKLEGGKK